MGCRSDKCDDRVKPRSGGILLAVGVSPRDVAPRWIPLQALKGRHPAPVPCRRFAAFVQELVSRIPWADAHG